MSSVNFGGPLNFGSATYTDIVTRQASNDSVPADANVTAAIATPDSYFTVTAITSYVVSWEPLPPGELPPGHKERPPGQKVYTQVGQSNGKTPLHVSKGQAVYVTVSLDVPATSVTPGSIAAALTITGDS